MITSTLTVTDKQKDRDYNTLSSFIKAKKLSILIIEGKHHILYQASDADGNRYYRNELIMEIKKYISFNCFS